MRNLAVMLYCPESQCQTPNPQENRFCQKCRTPLPKIYLRAIGKGIEAHKPGEMIADRYWLQEQQILLDTKPGLPPAAPEEIPGAIAPYLRLFPYQLHVPQVYGWVSDAEPKSAIWLLEGIPAPSGKLMPDIAAAWPQATAWQQLNWLWQIAQLWQPLAAEGAASSLLEPKLLRIEGALVRLLELKLDEALEMPTLGQLGELWQHWTPKAQPSTADFLDRLCQQLRQGQIQTAKHLIAILDRAIAEVGKSLAAQIQIVTLSDTGPSRRRNEDACYPPSPGRQQWELNAGEWSQAPDGDRALPLAIVCDGIGGHEGGDVASRMAITTLQQQVQNLSEGSQSLLAADLSNELEKFASLANDIISEQNDSEKRQDRQRMGTTLVMAVAQAWQLYIAHVGDSRVYRISRFGCHQVTLDDDIASREARLGYALYRDAVYQPAAGSLVQALGMGGSALLHPTVRRFVLDEDCVFLLCSDGLSDRDRVEQYWETEILPVLEGHIDLVTASRRLVEIGNQKNGHDNVTVALARCQVHQAIPESKLEISPEQMAAMEPPEPPPASEEEPTVIAAKIEKPSKLHQRRSKNLQSLSILLGCLIFGIAMGLGYWLINHRFQKPSQPSQPAPPNPAKTEPSPQR